VTPDTSNSIHTHTTYISPSINSKAIHHRKGKTELKQTHHIETSIYDDLQKVTHELVFIYFIVFIS